jgi:hypothetical protein
MGVRKAIVEMKMKMKMKRRCVMGEQTCPMLGGEKAEELVAAIGYAWASKLTMTMCKVDDGVWKVPRRNDQ